MAVDWLKVAVQLDGQGGAKPIDPAHLLTAEDQPYWVHLDYSHEQSAAWLARQQIPKTVVEALLAAETRPRATEVADGLLVYLRGVNLNPGARPEDMIALRLWISQGRIISTQKRSLRSVESVRTALDSGEGPKTLPALMAEVVDQMIWRMEDVIENIEDEVEACALQLDEAPTTAMTPQLGRLRRRTITLRRYLAPQREALARLESDVLMGREDAMVVREAMDRLQRLLEDLDAAREHATLLQEEVFSVQNEAINDRMYLLAMISALFLPLGFLTGLFGINVGGLPGTNNALGFWWFMGAIVLVAIGVLIWMRKRRWL